MAKLKILCGLVSLLGLGLGSQPYYGIDNQPLFISAWRSRIINYNPLTFKQISLVVVENTATTPSDSIPRQKVQTDASRITLGKITLESVGALSGGLLLAIPISVLFGEDGTQWGYLIGFSIGPAFGATFIGNKLMEPNGSFVKSLGGSTLGMLLGGGIYVGYVMSGIFSHNREVSNDEIWYLSLAIGLPILGAVTGYNLGILKSVVVL